MTVVSVVIPVLNGAEMIGDTLRAVLGQARAGAELEVIVVDNGSTDATCEVVSHFPVTLLHAAVPGVSAGRNVGLAACRGDIYINVDADTLPSRTWLRELLRPFDDPAVVLVGGRTISFRPESGAERYIERAGLFRPENSVHNPDLPFVIGCNLAVRTTAARAIGGWDEGMVRGEDIDFSVRLRRAFPAPIHYREEAVLFHRNRSDERALAAQAHGYGYGMALIYRRYPEQLHFNAGRQLRALRLVVERTVWPPLLWIGHRWGRVSGEELEFARFHRLWTNAFWRGFFSTWYGRRE